MKYSSLFRSAVSEKRLFNVVKEVSNYHRIQASPMYREAAKHVLKICEKYGLDAKILSYEADPDVWYLQSKMFKEWSIREAYLDLDDPQMRLADYSSEPISVIQKSYPIDRREDPVDLVLLDKGSDQKKYEDLDLKDRFVFIRGPLRAYDWVYEKGALGVVSDYIFETKNRKRGDLYDSLTYTAYWATYYEGEPEFRGFVLSPRMGDELAKLCKKKYEQDGSFLKIRPFIDSSLYKGHIEIVEVTIPGKDDKTVYLSAHLCHPRSSCNDNASGVSATLEAMNVMNQLIKDKKIPVPEHTIRLTLIPEFTGTFAYLSDHNEYEKGLGAMNLDMVGGRQGRYYGPITLTRTPYQIPSLNDELCMLAMEEAGKQAWSLLDGNIATTNYTVEPHTGGSDHSVYCDPTIGIPCCMLGQWPDLNYHTATDTLDVIDPSVLKFSCLSAIHFAYGLATLKKEDLTSVFEKMEEAILMDKKCFLDKYRSGKCDKRFFGSQIFMLKDYYLDALDVAGKLVEGYDVRKEKKHVENIFNEWIEYYDLKDEYPLDESLDKVYVRDFIGPVQSFSDYRVFGYGDVIDEYEKTLSDDPFEMMGLTDLITNLIDGNNTVGQIVRRVSLEKGMDLKTQVLELLKLYCGLKLIHEA